MKHIYFLGSCRTKFFFTRFKTFNEWPFQYKACPILLYTINEILAYLSIVFSKNKYHNFNILKNFHETSCFNTFSNIICDSFFTQHQKFINKSDIVVMEISTLKDKINNKYTSSSDLKFLIEKTMKIYFPNKQLILIPHIYIPKIKYLFNRKKLEDIIEYIARDHQNKNINTLFFKPSLMFYPHTDNSYNKFFRDINHYNKLGHNLFEKTFFQFLLKNCN